MHHTLYVIMQQIVLLIVLFFSITWRYWYYILDAIIAIYVFNQLVVIVMHIYMNTKYNKVIQ
jgi:hypothetical protein